MPEQSIHAILETAIREHPLAAADALATIQLGAKGDSLTLDGLRVAARLVQPRDSSEAFAVRQIGRLKLLRCFTMALVAREICLAEGWQTALDRKVPLEDLPAWKGEEGNRKNATKEEKADAEVRRSNLKDLAQFEDRVRALRCRILVDGAVAGSGFLVGPSTVMSAWHVIARAKAAGSRIEAAFADGQRIAAFLPVTPFSECSSRELEGRFPLDDDEVANFHDIAVLTLKRPAGAALGVARLAPPPAKIDDDDSVIVAHFPEGKDVGLGVGAFRSTGLQSRWGHSVKTQGGSSGAACFDASFHVAGVHQGQAKDDVRGRLVPVSRFPLEVLTRIADDAAPPAIWSLDGTVDGPLVIGRQNFFYGFAAASRPTGRVRGIRIKRVDAAGDVTGIPFSYQMLEQMIARTIDTRLLRLSFETIVPDLADEIARRAAEVGLEIGALAPADGAVAGQSLSCAVAADRGRRAATALDAAAAAASRKLQIWIFVEHPSVVFGDELRAAFEGFVDQALRTESLRLVIAGYEAVSIPGLEFASPNGLGDEGAPGFVVEYIDGFKQADVEALIRQMAVSLNISVSQDLIEARAEDALESVEARANGVYQAWKAGDVASALRPSLRKLLRKAPGGAGATVAPGAAEPATPIDPLEQAREYAALSGPFDPVEALPQSLAESEDLASLIASQLAQLCDTNPPDAPGKWLLRTPERRDVIRALSQNGILRERTAQRRAGADQATVDLLDAILGLADFAEDKIKQHIAESREWLERIIVALDRAGDLAPAYRQLATARSALALRDRQARWEDLESHGVPGRDVEHRKIELWLDHGIESPPVQALFVRGIPGVGKSLLLDDAVRLAIARLDPDPILVRLDFARAGLDVQDLAGLTMEMARQVADQVGGAGPKLLRARLETASSAERPTESLAARARLPEALAAAIRKALRNRPVLFLLDTLEVLRNRGDTHPEILFDWLDALVRSGIRPIHVLAAARSDVMERIPSRIGKTIALDGLSDAAADVMLVTLGVPERDRQEVKRRADGNPLVLRLAGELVRRAGIAALPKDEDEERLTASAVYRLLIAGIDPALRQLAPGLVVRRVSAEVIRVVLAPNLGMGELTIAEAERLWKDLGQHDWLVEADPAMPGFLRHRGDLRAELLPLIYRDLAEPGDTIDDAAVAWFERLAEPWAKVEAAYHRLQRMRYAPTPPPSIDREVLLRIDAEMLAELPEPARDLVHVGRGERSGQYRADSGAPSKGDDNALVGELAQIIERQDWIEGAHVVQNVIDTAGIGAHSPAADAIRAFWWRSGYWSRARESLEARDRLVGDDQDLHALPPTLALARLEMRAEFAPRALLRCLRDDADNRALALELAKHSPDAIGKYGALGFLLSVTKEQPRESLKPCDPDPVENARAIWSGESCSFSQCMAMRDAQDRMQGRHAAAAPDSPETSAAAARLLAVLNPYAGLALNLSITPGNEWIAAAAEASDLRLIQARALLPWDAEPDPADGREHPIPAMARLGLFAEWSQAAAFLRSAPDLQLIAQSAEAWRRTVAGQWRYGGPPPGWKSAQPIDATMSARLAALAAASDPKARALLQLGLWAEGDGELLWKKLRGELATVAPGLRGDSAAGRLTECARALLARRIPSAFVPAAAILITYDEA